MFFINAQEQLAKNDYHFPICFPMDLRSLETRNANQLRLLINSSLSPRLSALVSSVCSVVLPQVMPIEMKKKDLAVRNDKASLTVKTWDDAAALQQVINGRQNNFDQSHRLIIIKWNSNCNHESQHPDPSGCFAFEAPPTWTRFHKKEANSRE